MKAKPWKLQVYRLKLRRGDGLVYLDRWGIGVPALGAVFLHRMDAPDPGEDLHDHPWSFVSLVLKGGYTERRAPVVEVDGDRFERRMLCERRQRLPWSIARFRLGECHRVEHLGRTPTWTLVVTGPVRRKWGFFLADGAWMNEREYDETVRVHRRDLWDESVLPADLR